MSTDATSSSGSSPDCPHTETRWEPVTGSGLADRVWPEKQRVCVACGTGIGEIQHG